MSKDPLNFSSYAERMRNALKEFKKGAEMRLDTWVNTATGFGTSRDKTEMGFIAPNRTLTDIELSSLYHSDDMAARMIDILPDEMYREGFGFATGEADLDASLNDKFDSLTAASHLADGTRWGRCYGGAGILIGCDDGQDADQPLKAERAKDLDYLYVVDRRQLWPLTFYEDMGNPKLGQPNTYLVTTMGGTHYNTSVVHESRLILFRGAPTGIRERMHLFGWDMSVLQRANDVLRSFNVGWKAVESLLVDGNQAIFKMTGLAEMLASGGEEGLRLRMQAMDTYRSVMRAIVIDADGQETFERNAANFSNIPDTLDKFMLRLSAAVHIPVTILMGQSPAGMNATGDSDFRWFFNRVKSEQTRIQTPKIRRLAEIWLATKNGRKYAKAAKTLDVKWPSLWAEPPLEAAQRRLAIAQGDDVYVQNQAISPEEVALQRFKPDGFDRDLILSDEMTEAREKVVASHAANGPPQLGPDGKPIPMGPDGNPLPDPNAAAPDEAPKPEISPQDLSLLITADEARKSVGLDPLPVDGDLTLPEYKAKYATTIAAAANAEKGTTDDGSGNPHQTSVNVQPDKPPPPNPFGAPPFGGKPGASAFGAHPANAPLPGQPGAKPMPGMPQGTPGQPGGPQGVPPPKRDPFTGKIAEKLDAVDVCHDEAHRCTRIASKFASSLRFDQAHAFTTLATIHAFAFARERDRLDYSPDQPRDDKGRFTAEGGGSAAAHTAAGHKSLDDALHAETDEERKAHWDKASKSFAKAAAAGDKSAQNVTDAHKHYDDGNTSLQNAQNAKSHAEAAAHLAKAAESFGNAAAIAAKEKDGPLADAKDHIRARAAQANEDAANSHRAAAQEEQDPKKARALMKAAKEHEDRAEAQKAPLEQKDKDEAKNAKDGKKEPEKKPEEKAEEKPEKEEKGKKGKPNDSIGGFIDFMNNPLEGNPGEGHGEGGGEGGGEGKKGSSGGGSEKAEKAEPKGKGPHARHDAARFDDQHSGATQAHGEHGHFASGTINAAGPAETHHERRAAMMAEAKTEDQRLNIARAFLAEKLKSGVHYERDENNVLRGPFPVKLSPIGVEGHEKIAREQLAKHEAEFKETKALIQSHIGDAHLEGRTKELSSFIEKLDRKAGKYTDARSAQDATGFRVVAEDLPKTREVVAKLTAPGSGFKTIEQEPYIDHPKAGSGYRSHHLIIETPSGLQKEIQIRSIEQHAHSEFSHEIMKPHSTELANYVEANKPAVQEYQTKLSDHYQAIGEGRMSDAPKPPPGLAMAVRQNWETRAASAPRATPIEGPLEKSEMAKEVKHDEYLYKAGHPLPALHEEHGAYFNLRPEEQKPVAAAHETRIIPMDRLETIRARPSGLVNAEKYMGLAAQEGGKKRDPISVEPHPTKPGWYVVKDGNSTTNIALKHHWKSLPATVFAPGEFVEH